MTIYQLQTDLAAEIKQITSDILFKNQKGESEHLRTYRQELPKREHTVRLGNLMQEDEEKDPYPFCIVRMVSGDIYSGTQRVKVLLVFGVFDDDMDNLGHQTLLNVMHRVAERFIRHPTLKDMYQMDLNEGINWMLDDEERYPYFIGGLEMVWDAYFINREEDRYV